MRADTAGHVQSFVAGLAARTSSSPSPPGLGPAGRRHHGGSGEAVAAGDHPDGSARRGAQIVDCTVSPCRASHRTRIIVRRELLHQGAQLRLWDHGGCVDERRRPQRRRGPPARGPSPPPRRGREPDLERQGLRTGTDAVHQLRRQRGWMEMVLAAADLLSGPNNCSSLGSSPPPNHAPCDTGSCTSPDDSSTEPARRGCVSPSTGPGPPTCSAPTNASPRSPTR